MTQFYWAVATALGQAFCLALAMTAVLGIAILYDRKYAPPRREDYLRAIEFAEYLAKSAEGFQDAVNAVHQAHEVDAFDGETAEDLSESWGHLKSAIYEFRKRAMRAVVPTEVMS